MSCERIVTPLDYEIARLVSASEAARWRPYDVPTCKRDFLAPRYRTAVSKLETANVSRQLKAG